MSNFSHESHKTSLMEHWMNNLVGSFVTIFTLHRSNPKSGAYSGVDEQMLERCLRYASDKGYEFVSIDQLIEDAFAGKSYKQPAICFTLDDGYADQANRLLPMLLKYNASPSLFVITDFLDQKMWPWDAKLTYLIWNTPLQFITINIGQQKLVLDLSSQSKRIMARRKVIQAVKALESSLQVDSIFTVAENCQLVIPKDAPDDFTPVTWDHLRSLEKQGLRVGSHTKSHLVFNSASPSLVTHELMHSK
ncbi:MAG: hypothetical protein EOO68_39555, partial [Moraxellaceae bacterium]